MFNIKSAIIDTNEIKLASKQAIKQSIKQGNQSAVALGLYTTAKTSVMLANAVTSTLNWATAPKQEEA